MKYILVILSALIIVACVSIDPPQSAPIPEYTRSMDLSQWSAKVSSLNVWGLWVLSKYKAQRMPAIGNVIAQSNLDFAFIQEAWSGDTQKTIIKNAKLPHTFYYDVPRTVGSGLLSLSKTPTIRRSFRPFTMLGQVFEIADGEVLSGKGVSLDTVVINGLTVSMINTHTIARHGTDDEAYNWEDHYTPDHLMAMFEIFQHMVEQLDSDAFIIAGDFNMNYKNIEYWIWQKLTSLGGNIHEEFDLTTCTSCGDNSFHEGGKGGGQIDFIFTSPRLKINNDRIEFKEQKVTVDDGARKVNLSDHYGWYAEIGGNTAAPTKSPEAVRKDTTEAISFIRDRLEKHLIHFQDLKQIEGFEDRICYECRIKDSIKATKFYESVLNGTDNSSKAIIIRRRLESYFQIFR